MPDNKIIGKSIETIPTPQKEIGIDTKQTLENDIIEAIDTSTLNTGVLDSFSNVAQTREEIYTLIDTMSQDNNISAVLETYAEDSTETNEQGKIVWCESSDSSISKYISNLIDTLNIDKYIYSWVYSLVKYGDVYLRLYHESDYGEDLLFGKSKEEGTKDKLNEDCDVPDDKSELRENIILHVNDKNDRYVTYVEMVPNPGEMFELTKFGKTVGYISAPVTVQQNYDNNSILNSYLIYKMKKTDVNVYGATEFVHACLQDTTSRTPEEVDIYTNDDDLKNNISSSYTVRRGQSLLANSFKIWRELSLLENSVLLNRLTKSAIVRILNIDTGDMPKERINNLIQRLKSNIEQKSALNVGQSLTEYTNPGPIENIIYVPTHGTQGTISAQTLGGDVDVKSLVDLEYFQNQLYGSLKVPKQFFGVTNDSTGFNGGTSLSIISSRYGKAIKRIQNTMCQAITDLINLFLIDRKLFSYINKFSIRMQEPITQEELDRRDNLRNRIGVINDVMNQINGVVDDKIIQSKIVKSLLANSLTNPEVIDLMQQYIDGLESEEEEKVSSENESNEVSNTPTPMGSGYEPPIDFGNQEETFSEFETEETPEEMPEEGEEHLPSPSELNIDMTNNEGEF